MPKRKTAAKRPPTHRKKLIAKTPNQKNVLKVIKENHVTLCAGPAGTGKTHLSVGSAVQLLLKNQIDNIIITRPIVEAGERIGFLPGTAEQKLDPYLQPVFDELKHYLSYNEISTYKNEKRIQVIPLALMRGRNFHNSFIIGDEIQNATFDQIKMLITRMGIGSKLVISGDLTQSDLSKRDQGAFESCLERLKNIDKVGICYLEGIDIVRNPLIPIILEKLDDR
tara:strand:+ start:2399 stop:3070 length:672 start_codon:yes stop_codon:yes gene_type:complete